MLIDRDYELLSAYLDDALPADERSRLETRLQSDADLRAELTALRQTVLLLRDLPPLRAPRAFTLTPAQARAIRPPRLLLFPATTLTTLASAAAAFILIAAGLLTLTTQRAQAPLAASQPQIAAAPTQVSTATALSATGNQTGQALVQPTFNLPMTAAPLQDAVVEEAEEAQEELEALTSTDTEALDAARMTGETSEAESAVMNMQAPDQPEAETFAADAALPDTGGGAGETDDSTTARAVEPQLYSAPADEALTMPAPAMTFAATPTQQMPAPAAPPSADGAAAEEAAAPEAGMMMQAAAPTATASLTPTAPPTATLTPTTTLTPTMTATLTPTPVPLFSLPQNVDSGAITGIILLIGGAAALLIALWSLIARRG